jgi:hypothetical protein
MDGVFMISRLLFTLSCMVAGWQCARGMDFANRWPSVVPVRVSVINPTEHPYTYTIFGKDEVIKPTECIHYHGIIDGNDPAAYELKVTFSLYGRKVYSAHYVNGMKDRMWINFCAIKTWKSGMQMNGVIDLTLENGQNLSLKKSIVSIELDLSRLSDFDKHCKVIPNDTYLFSFDKIVAHDLDKFKKDQENKIFLANTFLRCAQPLRGYKDGAGNSLPIEHQCDDLELEKNVNNVALVETALARCRRAIPKIVIEPKTHQEKQSNTMQMITDFGLIVWDVIKL